MLEIDADSGCGLQLRQRPSPNCDDRPPDDAMSLIVVHCISLPPAAYGGGYVDDFFQNKLDCSVHEYFDSISHLQVSAHALVERTGRITQYVPFHKRAWHAGESLFESRTACNDFSIGIELEGTDDSAFRSVQYWQLARLIDALQATYATLEDCPVVGHSDIAPGRKTDPGECFDWARLKHLRAIQANRRAAHAL